MYSHLNGTIPSHLPPERQGGTFPEKKHLSSWWLSHKFEKETNIWLVVEPTHLKNISQNRNFPQIGMKIKHI